MKAAKGAAMVRGVMRPKNVARRRGPAGLGVV